MTYDMVRQMERLPDDNPDTLGIPDAIFIRPTVMAIFDTIKDQVVIATPVWPSEDRSPTHAYDLARERLADVVSDFGRGLPRQSDMHRSANALPEPVSNVSRKHYHQMVERAKDYVRAAISFRSYPPSASPYPSNSRLSRSIEHCAVSTRRPFSFISISAILRSSAPARRSWFGSETIP